MEVASVNEQQRPHNAAKQSVSWCDSCEMELRPDSARPLAGHVTPAGGWMILGTLFNGLIQVIILIALVCDAASSITLLRGLQIADSKITDWSLPQLPWLYWHVFCVMLMAVIYSAVCVVRVQWLLLCRRRERNKVQPYNSKSQPLSGQRSHPDQLDYLASRRCCKWLEPLLMGFMVVSTWPQLPVLYSLDNRLTSSDLWCSPLAAHGITSNPLQPPFSHNAAAAVWSAFKPETAHELVGHSAPTADGHAAPCLSTALQHQVQASILLTLLVCISVPLRFWLKEASHVRDFLAATAVSVAGLIVLQWRPLAAVMVFSQVTASDQAQNVHIDFRTRAMLVLSMVFAFITALVLVLTSGPLELHVRAITAIMTWHQETGAMVAGKQAVIEKDDEKKMRGNLNWLWRVFKRKLGRVGPEAHKPAVALKALHNGRSNTSDPAWPDHMTRLHAFNIWQGHTGTQQDLENAVVPVSDRNRNHPSWQRWYPEARDMQQAMDAQCVSNAMFGVAQPVIRQPHGNLMFRHAALVNRPGALCEGVEGVLIMPVARPKGGAGPVCEGFEGIVIGRATLRYFKKGPRPVGEGFEGGEDLRAALCVTELSCQAPALMPFVCASAAYMGNPNPAAAYMGNPDMGTAYANSAKIPAAYLGNSSAAAPYMGSVNEDTSMYMGDCSTGAAYMGNAKVMSPMAPATNLPCYLEPVHMWPSPRLPPVKVKGDIPWENEPSTSTGGATHAFKGGRYTENSDNDRAILTRNDTIPYEDEQDGSERGGSEAGWEAPQTVGPIWWVPLGPNSPGMHHPVQPFAVQAYVYTPDGSPFPSRENSFNVAFGGESTLNFQVTKRPAQMPTWDACSRKTAEVEPAEPFLLHAAEHVRDPAVVAYCDASRQGSIMSSLSSINLSAADVPGYEIFDIEAPEAPAADVAESAPPAPSEVSEAGVRGGKRVGQAVHGFFAQCLFSKNKVSPSKRHLTASVDEEQNVEVGISDWRDVKVEDGGEAGTVSRPERTSHYLKRCLAVCGWSSLLFFGSISLSLAVATTKIIKADVGLHTAWMTADVVAAAVQLVVPVTALYKVCCQSSYKPS